MKFKLNKRSSPKTTKKYNSLHLNQLKHIFCKLTSVQYSYLQLEFEDLRCVVVIESRVHAERRLL